ncbi:MAG TPA: hypothetical protein VFN10_19800 [Thermoanaerobaculia bacterium]|nr:hypothetical protein [Thermoanaerobaculia bacterium]
MSSDIVAGFLTARTPSTTALRVSLSITFPYGTIALAPHALL